MWRLALLILVAAFAICMLAWLLTGKAVYKGWAIRLGKAGLVSVLLLFGLLIFDRLAG